MFNPVTSFKVSDNIVFRKRDGIYTLIQIDGELLFELPDSSGIIWEYVINGMTYDQMIKSLQEEYENFGNPEVEMVNDFLESLIANKIIFLSSK
jgi:hypothetical protein